MTTETAEPPAPEPQQPEPAEPTQPTEPVETAETAAAEPSEESDELSNEPAARRRPRTALLLVGALLLGPLVGAATGYAIQAGRPPTALPSLKVDPPKYPATVLDPKVVADAAPKPLNIDGDLRKLLISKPGDATDWDNYGRGDGSGWLSIGEKALSYGGSDKMFKNFLSAGFRRDAIVSWSKGETHYRVELIQYDSDHASSAVSASVNSTGDPKPLDGTASGFYSTPSQQWTYDETTEKYYYGLAMARRGDVVMRISVYSPSQVNADELKDIAKRQWERLV
ncbi:hypothetical protein GCM10010193_36960 [Kitasatospora atroaurantiaca]|uniref:Uncharacterized protein n=1 Tax=Kitasatospora atroaurantiaca TaxID=285545 RepID=A0A561ET62_9ACTN|nr:hypothetical protein [Kitasatospora atroaurantiaca]TWE18761.1 hypothetical protein FB465_3850 [Kitasatospora atroaurantiaca]